MGYRSNPECRSFWRETEKVIVQAFGRVSFLFHLPWSGSRFNTEVQREGRCPSSNQPYSFIPDNRNSSTEFCGAVDTEFPSAAETSFRTHNSHTVENCGQVKQCHGDVSERVEAQQEHLEWRLSNGDGYRENFCIVRCFTVCLIWGFMSCCCFMVTTFVCCRSAYFWIVFLLLSDISPRLKKKQRHSHSLDSVFTIALQAHPKWPSFRNRISLCSVATDII